LEHPPKRSLTDVSQDRDFFGASLLVGSAGDARLVLDRTDVDLGKRSVDLVTHAIELRGRDVTALAHLRCTRECVARALDRVDGKTALDAASLLLGAWGQRELIRTEYLSTARRDVVIAFFGGEDLSAGRWRFDHTSVRGSRHHVASCADRVVGVVRVVRRCLGAFGHVHAPFAVLIFDVGSCSANGGDHVSLARRVRRRR